MELNEALQRITPSVRGLNAYHLEPEEVSIKLNQNENPFDWPAPIKQQMAQFCQSRPWNRYPNFIPSGLKAALAQYTGLTAGQIIVGNGSNEMLMTLMLSLLHSHEKLILCQPTFTVYALLSRGMGREPLSVMLDEGLRFDMDALLSTCSAHPQALLVLCSPNNPTGTSLTQEQIRAILAVHKGFFILDQAYVEFGGYNAIELLDEYPNLIITRTFSKAFGGAGLRLGYMLGNEAVIGEINKIKLPYNINFFSERAAELLLANTALMQQQCALLIKERTLLQQALGTVKEIELVPSDANFLLLRSQHHVQLAAHLRSRDILVRDVSSYPLLQGCLRLSVGTPEENQALQQSIVEFFAAAR
jgi:histidinol-phosphate aminotransferase